MRRRRLGNTGIEVTELCFGVLPMGPNQRGLPPEEGGRLIRKAIERGVNFLDTAQSYGTYPHIRAALDSLPDRGRDVVISTKSAAKTYEEMAAAVLEARRALGRDVIDIFLLHAARVDASVFDERKGAYECLLDMKSKGIVRAVGISTHSVQVVGKATEVDGIDIVFPIINVRGMGILHGTRDDMVQAIKRAASAGRGLFAMKALAGGNLLSDIEGAFAYVRALEGISAVAVGMVDEEELEVNLAIFNGRPVPLKTRVANTKELVIQAFCIGCGKCVETCPNVAMEVVDGMARNDKSKCILCGYCAPVCPQFAIRLV
jgi:aryl-alcohol dehydrogenase-like predicted oxidoreductase/ferredoxin